MRHDVVEAHWFGSFCDLVHTYPRIAATSAVDFLTTMSAPLDSGALWPGSANGVSQQMTEETGPSSREHVTAVGRFVLQFAMIETPDKKPRKEG